MTSPENSFSSLVREDLKAMGVENPGFLKTLTTLILWPRFAAVFWHRCAAHFHGKGALKKSLQRFFYLINFYSTGCDISPDAVIGAGFKLPHPAGAVIGPCVIGKNVSISQNVTLGNRTRGEDSQSPPVTMVESSSFPVIGDDVSVYSGAVVVGAIKIGKGAKIGANAVVMEDVPDGYTAVGVPARMIPPKL